MASQTTATGQVFGKDKVDFLPVLTQMSLLNMKIPKPKSSMKVSCNAKKQVSYPYLMSLSLIEPVSSKFKGNLTGKMSLKCKQASTPQDMSTMKIWRMDLLSLSCKSVQLFRKLWRLEDWLQEWKEGWGCSSMGSACLAGLRPWCILSSTNQPTPERDKGQH